MFRHLITIAVAAIGLAAGAQTQAANPQVDLDTTAGALDQGFDTLDAGGWDSIVENFLAYVNAKFYDGTQFHQVIKPS
jgi:hypothetical protein